MLRPRRHRSDIIVPPVALEWHESPEKTRGLK